LQLNSLKDVSVDHSLGKVPLKVFPSAAAHLILDSSRFSNFVKVDHAAGNVPVSMFRSTFTLLKFVSLDHAAGKVPLNESQLTPAYPSRPATPAKRNTLRLSSACPNDSGK
jgi:hypothetical protein